jgi:hypothetical protein
MVSFCFISFQISLRPQKVCKVIVACAILHNIAVFPREPLIENVLVFSIIVFHIST